MISSSKHAETHSFMLHLTSGPSQRGFPANPSQDSLSLSGSLHSWNLETTEELSDQLCVTGLDDSVAEEEEEEDDEQDGERLLQENPRAEGIREKWGDKEDEQKNVSSLSQERVEDVVTEVGMEDKGLKVDDGVSDGDQATEGAEDEEKGEAELGGMPHVNPPSVADRQQGIQAEDATAAKTTPTKSPKILSAAARFRVPPSVLRVKTWTIEPADREEGEWPDEEVLSPVKVSELKKRFEA